MNFSLKLNIYNYVDLLFQIVFWLKVNVGYINSIKRGIITYKPTRIVPYCIANGISICHLSSNRKGFISPRHHGGATGHRYQQNIYNSI